MNIRLTLFSAIWAFALLPSIAYAQDACSKGARKLAAQQKATIIAVQPKKNANGKTVCEVRLQKNSKDGSPPRIIIKQFKPK